MQWTEFIQAGFTVHYKQGYFKLHDSHDPLEFFYHLNSLKDTQ